MALNAMGLGFLFQGKDDGLSKSQKQAAHGFSLMEKAVDRLGSILETTRVMAFADAIKSIQLDEISDKMDLLTNQGGQLTTSFEQTMMEMTNTARKSVVGLSTNVEETRKLEKQAVSLAYGLNRPVEGIAKSIATLKRGDVDLAKIGMTMADFTKTADVAGVEANDLANVLANLQNSWQMQPAAMQDVLDTAVGVGREMGIGGEALAALPKMLGTLDEELAKVAKTSPDEAKKMLKSMVMLQGAFSKTMDPEQAAEQAQAVTKTLLTSRQEFEKMFTGLGSEFPKLATELGIGFQDIHGAMEMMKNDPIAFAMEMRKMAENAKKSGKTNDATFIRMMQTIGDLNPQLKHLITGGLDASTEALQKVGKAGFQTAGAFKTLGKDGFTTGLTLQDQFNRMQDGFVARLRKMSNANKQFVKAAQEGFKKTGDAMEGWVGAGGPLGKIVEKFAQMHQVGAKALLPETLWPIAGALGTILSEVGPLIVALKVMGFSFTSVFGPVGLLVTALAVLGMRVFDLMVQFTDSDGVIQWGQVFEQLGKDLTNIGSTIQEYATKAFDWVQNELPPLIEKWTPIISKKIGEVLQKVMNWLGQEALPKLTAMLFNLKPWIQENLPKMVKTILDGLWHVIKIVWNELPGMISGIASVLVGALDLLQTAVVSILQGLRDWFIELFPSMAVPIEGLFTVFESFVDYAAWTRENVIRILEILAQFIVGVFTDPVGAVKTLWFDLLNFLASAAGKLGGILKKMFGGAATLLGGLIDKVVEFFGGSASASRDVAKSMASMDVGERFSVGDPTKFAAAAVPKTDVPFRVGKNRSANKARSAAGSSPAAKANANSKSSTAKMLDSTHKPSWYYDDYRPLFQQSMKEMTAALTNAIHGTSGGGASHSSQRVKPVAPPGSGYTPRK